MYILYSTMTMAYYR